MPTTPQPTPKELLDQIREAIKDEQELIKTQEELLAELQNQPQI